MKFNVGIKTFSISAHTKEVFERLDNLRPNNVSFSSFLALVGEEYLKNNRMTYSLETFSDDVSADIPHIFADIYKWKNKIDVMNSDELSNLQKRLSQLQNIVDFKVRNMLC